MDSGDITIPPELQICEPLLEFYLQGVLIPILENLTVYAGTDLKVQINYFQLSNISHVGLSKSFSERFQSYVHQKHLSFQYFSRSENRVTEIRGEGQGGGLTTERSTGV